MAATTARVSATLRECLAQHASLARNFPRRDGCLPPPSDRAVLGGLSAFLCPVGRYVSSQRYGASGTIHAPGRCRAGSYFPLVLGHSCDWLHRMRQGCRERVSQRPQTIVR